MKRSILTAASIVLAACAKDEGPRYEECTTVIISDCFGAGCPEEYFSGHLARERGTWGPDAGPDAGPIPTLEELEQLCPGGCPVGGVTYYESTSLCVID